MGANGSGKSTLARCLNGLLLPTTGSVLVDDLITSSPDNLEDIRTRVGMVFQNPDNQIVSTSIEREIAFGLENLNVPYEEMHARVAEFLVEFNLAGKENHPPHKLSGGEKQLLAIAGVLAMKPKYLVLDEPTSLLDPHSRRHILRLVFELHKPEGRGITPILITQYPEETLNTDRLLVLSQGKIAMDGPPQEIFENREELNRMGIAVPLEFMLEREAKQDWLLNYRI